MINTNILLHFIMPQILVNLTDYENAIVTIVKGKHNFKNKNEAIRHIIREYEIEFLEPELRPEFIKRMEKVQREPTVKVDNMWDFFGVERD
ncbi:MAG: antitoxin [Candidatus Aenigmatarchaeota archaeon]|nr:MAG: antitoxin [Candidatus Aenigmarchaeota archaeon]